MILLYSIFTTILYPFLFILIYLIKFLKKEDPIRFKEKILSSSFNVKRRNNSKLFWFHAASIGEFKSIIPIIEQLRNKNQRPNQKIVFDEFISVKGIKAQGNRLSQYKIKQVNTLESLEYIPSIKKPLEENEINEEDIEEKKQDSGAAQTTLF